MIKLDNYRRLKPDEIIRKGDWSKYRLTGEITPVKYSIGKCASEYKHYKFYRRKHTKKVVVPSPVKKAVAKYPTVTFKYNYLQREVQVIALDDKYVSGLEVTHEGNTNKYQFKKFLRARIQSAIHLVALADKQ